MPLTWKEWHDGTPGLQQFIESNLILIDPRDPEDAIKSQIAYMRWLLNRFADSFERWEKAFAAYNWGIGRMLKLNDDPDWKYSLPDETSKYIKRIEEYYRQYQHEALGGKIV